MLVPETLQSAIDDALKIVEAHPDHEYGPMNRKRLMDAFHALDTPVTEKARRWLGILTARHVLPLNTGLHLPPDVLEQETEFLARLSDKERREYDAHYEEPAQAIALAQRVLHGEFDAKTAYDIACEAHQALGYYRSVVSSFVQTAANKALVEATTTNYNAFDHLASMSKRGHFVTINPRPEELVSDAVAGSEFTDADWATSGQSDSAAQAALAWSCMVDLLKVDPDNWPDNWNTWIKHKRLDREKLLEFWRWWLREAIPQAWALAEGNLSAL